MADQKQIDYRRKQLIELRNTFKEVPQIYRGVTYRLHKLNEFGVDECEKFNVGDYVILLVKDIEAIHQVIEVVNERRSSETHFQVIRVKNRNSENDAIGHIDNSYNYCLFQRADGKPLDDVYMSQQAKSKDISLQTTKAEDLGGTQKQMPSTTESSTKKRGRKKTFGGLNWQTDDRVKEIMNKSSKNIEKTLELYRLGYTNLNDLSDITGQSVPTLRMDIYRSKKKGLI